MGSRGTMGVTSAICPHCRTLVPAKVLAKEGGVFLQRQCRRHGEWNALVWRGAAEYLSAQSYLKPAWRPRTVAGDASLPCPYGCGLCERHEQHLCLPVVEITSRCDLACPVCLVGGGGEWDMSLEEFRVILDGLIGAEGQIRVLNLSGGEPLLHPDLLPIIDEARSREEVVCVSISTNGLRLLEDPELLEGLQARQVVISLQFDGFDESIYERLRGQPLLARKLRLLDLLAARSITTSLTVTAAAGVNDAQLGEIAALLFSQDHLVSMMIQPLAFAGRAAVLRKRMSRLTLPEVVHALGEAGVCGVAASDFLPLPCSHPLCFSLAFYLMTGEGPVSLTRLTEADVLLDAVANRVVFGLEADECARLKEMIYALWSAPAAVLPQSRAVLTALRGLLRELSLIPGGFDARRAFAVGERRVKSIFIHAFQDYETFDLSRVRRCCTGYPQPDGRVVPACVHNVLGRTVTRGEEGDRDGAPPAS